LPRLGSRLTALLVHCLAAPLAAFTEWFWLGATLSPAEIACGLAILVGVAVALAPSEHLHLERRVFVPGLLFGLLAALGQAGGAVISRKAFEVGRLAGQNIDGITAAYQRIIGGVIFGGICLLIVKRGWFGQRMGGCPGGEPDLVSRLGEKWRGAWLWVALNALCGPALGVSCYQWALKTTPTGIVLPLVALTPLTIVPLSIRLEGEQPTVRSLVGGILAVSGAVALTLIKSF
jgi:drug/metabolite transporter (DMT)-like permease